jgi:hypothetical protein
VLQPLLLVATRECGPAMVMADELIGSELANEYPEVAICEVCGRAVDWPNGTPTLDGQ